MPSVGGRGGHTLRPLLRQQTGDGPASAAAVVKTRASVAEHLAEALPAWTQIGQTVVDACSGGEIETASTRLPAAKVAGRHNDGRAPADPA